MIGFVVLAVKAPVYYTAPFSAFSVLSSFFCIQTVLYTSNYMELKISHLCATEIADLEAGSLVTGTIDSKCDYGYIISVDLGSEKLKGVLYHIPEVPQMSQRSKTQSGHTRRRRRKLQLALDPSRPKPNRSGYNFFFAEHYNRLKPSYHGQERAISKRIGVLWGRLSEAEKQVIHA